MKMKIAVSAESCGVVFDEEIHKDFIEIVSSPECTTVFKKLPQDSFQSIFWQQQMESLDKNPKNMRWHPLMIRWCLYLKHRLAIHCACVLLCRILTTNLANPLRFTGLVVPMSFFVRRAVCDFLSENTEGLYTLCKSWNWLFR